MAMNRKAVCAVLMCATAGTSLLMSGCAPLIFGGAVAVGSTTVSTMADRRSTGAVLNDEVLEKRVGWEISRALGAAEQNHITVTAYNGWVLLTGEVPTEEGRKTAENTARVSLDVKRVINELAVMTPSGLGQRMSDSTLAAKVRANLIGNQRVSINQMKVTVDRGIVYLTGLLSSEENEAACRTAAATGGVVRVVSHVELLSALRLEQSRREQEEHQKRMSQE